MKQFGVYRNSFDGSPAPFIILLQSHHLDSLESVVAAPVRRDKRRPLAHFDLPIVIEGETLLIAVAEMAAIDRTQVGSFVVDASVHEDDLRRALDRLFTGF